MVGCKNVSANLRNKATGQHFNEPEHSVSDMTITVIEKIFKMDPQYRKQREKMFMKLNRFNTRYKGPNKMSGGELLIAIYIFFKPVFIMVQNLNSF